MILSDTDILQFIKNGDITIDPFEQKHLKPGSYVLSLGKMLLKPKPSKDVIEVDNPAVEYETIEMDKAGYVMQPGEFLLGQVAEKLSMSTKLACLLNARGTLTRLGISMLQASTFTEPGQTDSNEVLEITNIGPHAVRLYPGMKAVKAIFVVLKTPSQQNYGEIGAYRAQSTAKIVPN